MGGALRPVFVGRKIRGEVKMQEDKPSLVNHQCVVYKFECDLCDAGFVCIACSLLGFFMLSLCFSGFFVCV